MMLNIFSLKKQHKRFPNIEMFAVLVILIFVYFIALILFERTFDVAKKHVHLENEKVMVHSAKLYQLQAPLHFVNNNDRSHLPFTDLSLQFLIDGDYLNENMNPLVQPVSTMQTMYSDHSFVRIIKYNHRYLYQIRLCKQGTEDCHHPRKEEVIIDTLTIPTIKGENSINTMTQVTKLTTDHVRLVE